MTAHPLCLFAFACLAVGGSALFNGDATTRVFARMLGLTSVPDILMDAVATIGACGVATSIIAPIRALPWVYIGIDIIAANRVA